MSDEHSIEKQIDELRTIIVEQVQALHDLIARIRGELQTVKARQEKHESIGRRL